MADKFPECINCKYYMSFFGFRCRSCKQRKRGKNPTNFEHSGSIEATVDFLEFMDIMDD